LRGRSARRGGPSPDHAGPLAPAHAGHINDQPARSMRASNEPRRGAPSCACGGGDEGDVMNRWMTIGVGLLAGACTVGAPARTESRPVVRDAGGCDFVVDGAFTVGS